MQFKVHGLRRPFTPEQVSCEKVRYLTWLTATLIGPCRAEAVSDRPFCTEPGLDPRPRGICCGPSGTETGSSPSNSVFASYL